MKVIVFGATGMVGQAALRECLLDDKVERVLTVGRRATGKEHEKLRELVHADFFDFSGVERELTGYDACLFCLGVSSAGMGTDSSEQGRSMWARVKGKTENDLLKLPFSAYMFRPGYIQPLHGVRASSRLTRTMYSMIGPLYPVWKRLLPKYVTTSEQVGRAMLHVVEHGADKRVLENDDINQIGVTTTS
jgi:uncharacterized protein YbjT (DUF2867 family)